MLLIACIIVSHDINVPVHWLVGGACTLQLPGSSRALVWLIAMPKDVAVPSRTMQRQRGSVWTTPASVVQQENPGSGDLLPMKSRHGERVIITLEQPLFCAMALETSTIIARTSTAAAICIFHAAILSCQQFGPRDEQCRKAMSREMKRLR